MRNGSAGSIRAEAESVYLSEHDADGSSVASDPSAGAAQEAPRGAAPAFADLNLGDVALRQHFVEVTQCRATPADRAVAEMIGLHFGDALRIEARCLFSFRIIIRPLDQTYSRG
jgi:hypothetical protein